MSCTKTLTSVIQWLGDVCVCEGYIWFNRVGLAQVSLHRLMLLTEEAWQCSLLCLAMYHIHRVKCWKASIFLKEDDSLGLHSLKQAAGDGQAMAGTVISDVLVANPTYCIPALPSYVWGKMRAGTLYEIHLPRKKICQYISLWGFKKRDICLLQKKKKKK